MLNAGTQIDKVRAIYQATRHLQLAEIPPIDFTDRISLLTVAAGLRNAAVLEGDGLEIALVKDVVINHGLFTSTTNAVWAHRETHTDAPRPELLALLHRDRESKHSSRALWLFRSSEDRKRLKNAVLSKTDAGELLSYPECCVRANVEESRAADEAFLAALIAKVGDEPAAIEKAIREDLEVELPDGLDLAGNVPKTSERFPFVIHVACEGCLPSDDSPSARLNQTYAALILDVDPSLHSAILETSQLLSGLETSQDKNRIFAGVEAIHGALFPGKGARRR